MKNQLKFNQKLFFTPTLTVIFGIAFFILPTRLKDEYNYYPFLFLLTVFFSYLKLAFYLFSILGNFTKNCTALSLLVILFLTTLQLYALSLATSFLTTEAYPLNTFQFLAISQILYFSQLFLVKLWTNSKIKTLTVIFYLFFTIILSFRNLFFDLRWAIIFYQFLAALALFLQLFDLHAIIKTFLDKTQDPNSTK